MNRQFFLTALIWCGLAASAYAQEICNNGIDDDNDGLIDCFDADCVNNNACSGFYVIKDSPCEAKPSTFPGFAMKLENSSVNRTAGSQSQLTVGDLDRDGIPEIVVTNNASGEVYVLDGKTRGIKYQASVSNIGREIAIGNLNNDACGEIFFVSGPDFTGPFYINSYNCDLTTKLWSSGPYTNLPGLLGLADFNGDGNAELYFSGGILNASTGNLIASIPGALAAAAPGITGSSPVAVDILGDSKLELINGLSIYDVDIGAGTITLNQSRAEYGYRKDPWGWFQGCHTSVADFNADGFLDVIASGNNKTDPAPSGTPNTTIFFWDVKNNSLKTFIHRIPGNLTINPDCGGSTGTYYANGWRNGTGRINVGDTDGDGKLNLVYVSGNRLYALKETATKLDSIWTYKVYEETSGVTGCTMFDFNGDGKTEVVYRDEKNLYIINGTNGKPYTVQACVSRTFMEYPVVADVDADGESEICVTCTTPGFDSQTQFCDGTSIPNAQVRVYRTNLEPWVPARRVWNQHAYFNVNVNDNLTIPKIQQKQQAEFSPIACDGTPNPSRPLNSFLNQSPFLNTKGCPQYPVPNFSYVTGSLMINNPTCPDPNFTVTFKFENLGDKAFTGVLPVTFYKGDPRLAGSLKLNTANINLTNFSKGSIFTANETVTGTGSPFKLFVMLNDNGTTPLPFTLPVKNTNILECDYDNIFSADVVPNPVSITALKIQDNIKCAASLAPNNGAVRAFVPVGGTENVADYNFFWSNGAAVKPTPDFTGAVYTGLLEGPYTVYALHKTANCSSSAATVTVNRVNLSIAVTIKLENPFDNCSAPNGKLRAEVFINGSATPSPVGNFTYDWIEGNSTPAPSISVSHIASNLSSLTYTVTVTDKTSGCQGIQSFTVPNNSIKPVVAAIPTSAMCTASGSGSASATVSGATAGFTFAWYKGTIVKPTPDFVGATYSGLVSGDYTVVATNNGSGCQSDPVTTTVAQTTAAAVTATPTAPMTSCDATAPNGSASASVGGSTAGFIFEWFAGQNTLSANKVSSSAVATGLNAGIYTVKATNAVTGCSDTDETTISFAVVTPSLVVGSVNGLTNCTTPDGSVTVNVTLDTQADYTFTWYKGGVVKPATDFPGQTSSTLSGLTVGTYTVQAVHKTKKCTTAPVSATVVDNTPSILINQVATLTQLPTDCNAANGVMGITVSAPGNTMGFKIEWFRNTTTAMPPVETGVTASTRASLTSALYRIVATNINNGCFAEKSFNLPFANAQDLKFVAKTDATSCSPMNEGSVTVKLVPASPTPGPPPFTFDVTDYEVRFYNGKDDSTPSVLVLNGGAGVPNGDGTSNFQRTALTPGFYTAVAVEINPLLSGCKSVPVTVEVLPTAVNPAITASSISNNTTCTGPISADGRIDALADGATAGYTFAWSNGTSVKAIPDFTGASYSNLASGSYTVEVTNTTTLCKANATFNVFNNPPVISVASGNISVAGLTRCDVSNGSAQVTSVSPGPLGSYAFEWFNSSLASIGTVNPISGLAAGKYYMKATSTTNNCASAMIEFDVADQTIGTVVVDLIGFTSATRCLIPNLKGELITAVSGSNSAGGFTTNWYAGTAATGTVIGTSTTLSGIDVIAAGTTSVDRTIEVINNANQCKVTATYTLPLVQAPIILTASAASPMTSCLVPPNGIVFATVTSSFSGNYTYNWYQGSTVKASPDFTGPQVNNLNIGTYTVQAIDKADPFCVTEALTVQIDDGRVNPIVTAVETAPLTMCDPVKADGVASASVNGQVANYTFDWFVGASASGTSFYTGAQASSLSNILYTVRATDNITGCAGTAQVTLTEKKLTIPNPEVFVISNVTTCTGVNNDPGTDGALGASIGGNTKDYIFDWSDGTTVKGTPDFTGENYLDLAVGTYTVIATSRITGCVSGPTPGVIIPELVIPDFDFDVRKASCNKDNGLVTLHLLNEANISAISWTANGQTLTDPALVNVPEGVYTVRVTTSEGCFREKEVMVGTDIRPFNGISRNNDGKNELFQIDCIDSFPTNYVKIFNRAGTLVYEAQGYNNIDIYFDGKSNRGISPLGNNLPDGTYFYIVDKNDGSKPLAGYLEIVN